MTLETLQNKLKAWEEKGDEAKIKMYKLALERKLKKIALYKNDPASPYFKYHDMPEQKPEAEEVKKSGKKPKR